MIRVYIGTVGGHMIRGYIGTVGGLHDQGIHWYSRWAI